MIWLHTLINWLILIIVSYENFIKLCHLTFLWFQGPQRHHQPTIESSAGMGNRINLLEKNFSSIYILGDCLSSHGDMWCGDGLWMMYFYNFLLFTPNYVNSCWNVNKMNLLCWIIKHVLWDPSAEKLSWHFLFLFFTRPVCFT